jgi:hypothetical protein
MVLLFLIRAAIPRLRAPTIKAIIQHGQEYQHQYFREEKPNSLVNIAGKPRVRITIVEDVAVGTNIVRITLLAAIRRNNPKPI